MSIDTLRFVMQHNSLKLKIIPSNSHNPGRVSSQVFYIDFSRFYWTNSDMWTVFRQPPWSKVQKRLRREEILYRRICRAAGNQMPSRDGCKSIMAKQSRSDSETSRPISNHHPRSHGAYLQLNCDNAMYPQWCGTPSWLLKCFVVREK